MDPSIELDLIDQCVFLSHRKKYGGVQRRLQLFTSLTHLRELYYEDSEKHAVRISSILLWISAKYPYVLTNEAWKTTLPKAPMNIWEVWNPKIPWKQQMEARPTAPIKVLNFRSSWEQPKEVIPAQVIIPLLVSPLCQLGLQAFCAYICPLTLKCIRGYRNCRGTRQCTLRITLGPHIDVGELIEELHRELLDTWRNCESYEYKFEKLSVHLRCRDLQRKDLSPLPDIEPKVYISEVNDDDVDWVVQVISALKPKEKYRIRSRGNFDFGRLKFPNSNLTYIGVESIVRKLSDAGISFFVFAVSSPKIPITYTLDGNNDCKCSFECGCGNWAHVFATWVMDKFDIPFVFFTDEEGLQFTHFSTSDIWGDESLDGEEPWW